MSPCHCRKKSKRSRDEDDDSVSSLNPQRGERVDSINYYTTELNKLNEKLLNLQEIKKTMAEQGNDSVSATQWISNMLNLASDVAVNLVRDLSIIYFVLLVG